MLKETVMQIDWFMVLGLVLIIEGMMPLLFPKAWLGYIQKLSQEPISAIRRIGAVLFGLGALLIYLR